MPQKPWAAKHRPLMLLLDRLTACPCSMKSSRNLSRCHVLRQPSHAPSSCDRHSPSTSAWTCSCPFSRPSSDAYGHSFDGACAWLDLHDLRPLSDKVLVLLAPVAHARAPLSVLPVHVHALKPPA
jgi:hypothetical protein